MILDNQISHILSALNFELGIKKPEEINVKWLNDLRELIVDSGKEASKEVNKRHPRDTQLAWLSTLVIGYLAVIMNVSMDAEKASKENQSKLRTYGSLLVHIANRCVGLNLLIANGLEAPARVIMRSIYEFFWLTVVITFDARKYEMYLASSKDNELERRIWNTHFNPRELAECVEKAWAFVSDKNGHAMVYGLDETLERYRWYSKSSHPSRLHTSILTYAGYGVEGVYKPSLFGAASIGLRGIQQDLYWLTVETTYLLIHLFCYKHNLRLSRSSDLHKEIICLFIMHICASMKPKVAPEAAIKLLEVFSKNGIIVD